MNIVGKGVLDRFKSKHSDVRSQIDSWFEEVKIAEWKSPLDIKKRYVNASIIDGNVVFNIKGNDYRLWVKVNYKNKIVVIKKAGTHSEYMRWSIV